MYQHFEVEILVQNTSVSHHNLTIDLYGEMETEEAWYIHTQY